VNPTVVQTIRTDENHRTLTSSNGVQGHSWIRVPFIGRIMSLSIFLLFPGLVCATEIEAFKKGVVKITALVNGQQSVGTGFIVRLDKDAAYIVTAAHVIFGDSKPQVWFFPLPHKSFASQVLGIDGTNENGLAALRVPDPIPDGLVALPLDQTTQPSGGETITFIGFPPNLAPWTVSTGSISGRKGPHLMFQALVEEGHSGGPLLLDGNVIGVVTDAQGRLGYAVPTPALSIALKGWHVEPSGSDSLSREISGADGAPMVRIPAGQFETNVESRSGTGDITEGSRYTVYVEDFFIDKYEVTIERYGKFLQVTGRTAPEYWDHITMPQDANRPVVAVTWPEAKAYCHWARKRLPTEDEWEKSARGTDGRIYPWGNEPPKSQYTNFATFGDFEVSKLSPVGTFEKDRSPYGGYDFAGNVSEWTADSWNELRNPDRDADETVSGSPKVIRGGAWNAKDEYLRTALRSSASPTHTDVGLGFRCAQNPSTPP
jgi:formylglycine-generating enzyme required for sulfatase activity